MKYKTEYSEIEVLGTEALLNLAFTEEYGIDDGIPCDALFVCGGLLNSEADTNGTPLYINGYSLSHCQVLPNGLVHAICYDEDENRYTFEVSQHGFYLLESTTKGE